MNSPSRSGPHPRSLAGGGRGRSTVASLLVLLAAVSWAPAAAPAPAEAAGSCDGVWVVVDLTASGRGVVTRCAPGQPRHGLDALSRADFTYTFVAGQPGMVCTIDAHPDPCNGAPSDAYWSYWHASQGGSWSYSGSGAGFRQPPRGSVDGWVFGDGSTPPRTPPPQDAPRQEASPAPAPSPSRTPTPTPTATPTPTPTPAPTSPPTSSSTDTAEEAAADRAVSDAPGEADREADREADGEGGSATGTEADADDRSDETEDQPPATAPRPTRTPTPRPTATPTPDPTETERPTVELRDASDADGEVAIGRPGDGDAMAGLIVGGALAATIAAAGVVQGRNRRTRYDP